MREGERGGLTYTNCYVCHSLRNNRERERNSYFPAILPYYVMYSYYNTGESHQTIFYDTDELGGGLGGIVGDGGTNVQCEVQHQVLRKRHGVLL